MTIRDSDQYTGPSGELLSLIEARGDYEVWGDLEGRYAEVRLRGKAINIIASNRYSLAAHRLALRELDLYTKGTTS